MNYSILDRQSIVDRRSEGASSLFEAGISSDHSQRNNDITGHRKNSAACDSLSTFGGIQGRDIPINLPVIINGDNMDNTNPFSNLDSLAETNPQFHRQQQQQRDEEFNLIFNAQSSSLITFQTVPSPSILEPRPFRPRCRRHAGGGQNYSIASTPPSSFHYQGTPLNRPLPLPEKPFANILRPTLKPLQTRICDESTCHKDDATIESCVVDRANSKKKRATNISSSRGNQMIPPTSRVDCPLTNSIKTSKSNLPPSSSVRIPCPNAPVSITCTATTSNCPSRQLSSTQVVSSSSTHTKTTPISTRRRPINKFKMDGRSRTPSPSRSEQFIGTSPPKARRFLLQSLMMKSEKTQQILQKWDEQHGLPKSHCQTMVNSSRSRKQLQEGIILPKWDGSPLIRITTQKEGGEEEAVP